MEEIMICAGYEQSEKDAQEAYEKMCAEFLAALNTTTQWH